MGSPKEWLGRRIRDDVRANGNITIETFMALHRRVTIQPKYGDGTKGTTLDGSEGGGPTAWRLRGPRAGDGSGPPRR